MDGSGLWLSRRRVLGAAMALPATGALAAGGAAPDRIAGDLARYVGFGGKASGGDGDTGVGGWLADELARAGFAVERQPISVPYFATHQATLTTGTDKAEVLPQAIVVPTGAGGVSGRLVRVGAATAASAEVRDAIVLAELPHARWSAIEPIRPIVASLFRRGARAVVLVTNGPTGKAIALNVDSARPPFAGPVVVLAPERATPFLAGAERGDAAQLVVTGDGGTRPAFNLIAKLERGRQRWLAVSTPRSGWFTCAGERGPGIAVWLALARWMPGAIRDRNLAFLCTSGHEYENLGMAQALPAAAIPPAQTDLWLHLGANVAARDWHDLVPPLRAMDSVDPQRILGVSPALIAQARRTFAGEPGLATPLSTDAGVEGELKVLAKHFPRVAGIYGAHRFHHTAEDGAQCLLPDALGPLIARLQAFVSKRPRLSPNRQPGAARGG